MHDDANDAPRRAARRQRARATAWRRDVRVQSRTVVNLSHAAARRPRTRTSRARVARAHARITTRLVASDARATRRTRAHCAARASPRCVSQRHLRRARARTVVMSARTRACEARVRVEFTLGDAASALALARACARAEGGVDVSSRDGFVKARELWAAYDIVSAVAPQCDVVPVFTSSGDARVAAAARTTSGLDADAEPSSRRDAEALDGGVERDVLALVRAHGGGDRVSSSSSSSSSSLNHAMEYDFERDGVMESVSVGGTFDRLHAGHRLLLAVAMRAVAPGGTLYVGVTSSELLANKSFGEYVESYEVRAASAKAFLAACDPFGTVDVRVGPLDKNPPLAATVREMCGLVISKETIAGAEALNDMRASAGFDALRFIVVDLVGASPDGDARDKLSSTKLRERDAQRASRERP